MHWEKTENGQRLVADDGRIVARVTKTLDDEWTLWSEDFPAGEYISEATALAAANAIYSKSIEE